MLDLAAVRDARARIANRIHLTPTFTSRRLGERAGVRLFLKCESLQKTGSFKVRGALNKLASLSDDERARGVITVSAGNHAQAMAWAAQSAGVHAVVVMPNTASPTKVEASRGYGAEVVLHGASGNESFPHAHELARERGLTFVHPFDDERICAGAGTTGLELLEQVADLDVVVVPIGGGGLISGIAVAIKESNPKIRVYGVEPTGAASTRLSLDSGRAMRLTSLNTIADGLAAPMTGELNYEIVKRYVDDVIVIDDDAIAEGLRQLLFSAKLLAEPAGAAAVGALLAKAVPVRQGERVAAIVSGGNVDAAKLAKIIT
ncbi:MAG TPA: threonine/serine dehydratase [Gemmatimonadaceae bacterium]|jgi:threonine dehydratase|nr:threonine/serine dehydratase [Gemmatimonadaceae bacterium]